MADLSSFGFFCIAAGVWDNLVFVYRGLRCGCTCIAAIMIKKSLCVSKAVLQFLDNGVTANLN